MHKKILFCLGVLLLILPNTRLKAQADESYCKRQEFYINESKAFSRKTNSRATSLNQYRYHVQYYRLYWDMDPNKLYIKGNVTAWFRPRRDNFNEIVFDLLSTMAIDSVIFRGQRQDSIRQVDDMLFINFRGKTVPINQLDSISIYYQGKPQGSGKSAVYSDLRANKPILYTQSEPYGAKLWWPCKQSLDDKADSIDIYVKTGRQYKVATNGMPIGISKVDTFNVHHWRHRYPITAYLVGVAIGDYAEFTHYAHFSPTDSMPVMNFVYRADSAYFVPQAKEIISMIELFSKKFGKYPFSKEKYGQVLCGLPGGMEHQTMTFIGDFGYYLIAHELSHHWFGDKVTCGSWTEIFLNEGFATLCEGVAAEFLQPQSADWHNWRRNNLDRATYEPYGAVMVDDTTKDSRIFDGQLTYSKGGSLLLMLRYQMGDSIFFAAVRDYLNDPKLAYSYAHVTDFQKHMETASGLNFTNFFKQYYEGKGYPFYDVYWSQKFQSLQLHLQQHNAYAFGCPHYDIAIPIKIWVGGKDSIIKVGMDSNDQSFSIKVKDKVDSIQVDPDLWVLAKYYLHPENINVGEIPGIYPNPASDKITFDLHSANIPNEANLGVYDILGRAVYVQKYRHAGKIDLLLSEVPNGTYFLWYTTSTGKTVVPFVKMGR